MGWTWVRVAGGREPKLKWWGVGAPFSAELCLKVRADFTTHPLSLLATLSPLDAQSNRQRPGPPRSGLAGPGGVTAAGWIPPVLPGSPRVARAPSTGPRKEKGERSQSPGQPPTHGLRERGWWASLGAPIPQDPPDLQGRTHPSAPWPGTRQDDAWVSHHPRRFKEAQWTSPPEFPQHR